MSLLRPRQVRTWERRRRRAFRVGARLWGTSQRPRLSVFRSHRHFHSQIIDDAQGRTLAAASTLMKDLRGQVENGGDKKAAALVGHKLAEIARARGITKVVLDRNFYRFHGRVRAFAEAVAAGGVQFLQNPKKKDRPPKVRKAKPTAPVKAPKAPKGFREGHGPPAPKKESTKG